MTEQKILKKAIEKAVKNGWNAYSVYNTKTKKKEVYIPERFNFKGDIVKAIIFSHKFAKCFWNEKSFVLSVWNHDKQKLSHPNKPLWQFHLQQMVISEDPIKYLEQFI